MKKNLLALVCTILLSQLSFGQTLVHYWNFNNSQDVNALLTPTVALVPGSGIVHIAGGASAIQPTSNTGQGFDVTNPNARNGDLAVSHLRFNNPIGGILEFSLPTTGYQQAVVTYATRRSGSGAGTQIIDYTTDGANYQNFTTFDPVDGNPTPVVLNFSGIPAINNNPNFKIRISFIQGPGGLVGNNRFDNFTLDADPIGQDQTPPTVSFLPLNGATNQPINTTPTLQFSEDVRLVNDQPITPQDIQNIVELRLNNAQGALVPFTGSFSNNTITVTPTGNLLNGQLYYVALLGNTVEDLFDNALASLATSTFTTISNNATVAFSGRFKTVSENVGIATITLTVTNPAPNATANLVFKTNQNSSTAVLADLVNQLQTTPVTLNAPSIVLNIQINNDQLVEQDEYVMFALENLVNTNVSGPAFYTLFIRDDDKQAPVASGALDMEFVSRYTVANPGNAIGLTEIVTYDATSQRLFTMSTGLDQFDIVDFSNPLNPTLVQAVDVTAYGTGVTSIAVKNGVVAVSQPGTPTEQDPGHVTFFDINGVFISQVEVGALPDMVTFTPDGQYVMTANEGQPNDAYTIDPEGTVSIIDITGGVANLTQGDVTTLDFTQYNPQTAALIAAGVRKLKNTSTLSQDFEPEYITVEPTSQKAWVTLQENGAIAEIDIVNKAIVNLFPLGLKDFSTLGTAGLDISDRGDSTHIANWPIKAFYLPDGMANYSYNGTTYLVTANEGDEKEYTGLNERVAIGSVTLDPTVFPNAAFLKENHNMGRHRITNLQGDIDNDGDYDALYTVGARSFSIWNAQTGAQVYDSGDDFEMITSRNPYTRGIFNADHSDNIRKGRSRSKGPEPEGLTVASIGGSQYAFVGLERIGGIMAYDITNPQAPVFVDYVNSRNNQTYGGDNGPEGIIYISPAQSPDGKGYVISANEVSGTLAVYEVSQNCNGLTDVIYVNDNATGNNTGASWDNAFTNLQSALATAVSGKQIWVAEGTYKPSANTRTVAFALKAGVSLYGGFPNSGGCTLEDRNPEAFPTILSGDIGVEGVSADNSYRVITATNIGSEVVVDGFSIVNAASNTNGGGVYISANGVGMNCSPTFSNNVIAGNTSTARGGGVYVQSSNSGTASPTFDNVRFENNQANVNGGGFTVLTQTNASSAPVLTDCVFENNTANSRGGAVETWTNTTGMLDLTIDHSWFNENTAVTNGGAVYSYARGGATSNVQATACAFNQNTATGGAGVFVHNGGAFTSATLDSCTFDGNMASGNGGGLSLYAELATAVGNYALNNTVFNENQAVSGGAAYVGSLKTAVQNVEANQLACSNNVTSSRGGALYANSTNAGTVNLTGDNWLLNNNTSATGGAIYASGVNIVLNTANATISNNVATSAKHLYLGQTATATLTNAILWNGPYLGPSYTGIALKNTSSLVLNYATVDALDCATLVNGTGTAVCNNTSYNIDPLFVDAANQDYHLLPGSPAIDAGTLVGAPVVDLDGNTRPSGNGIDLGCYEQQNILPRMAATEEAAHALPAVYPNPASGVLYVSFENATDAELRLNNMEGRMVRTALVGAATLGTLDLNGLPNGTYVLSVIANQGITSHKIVIFK